MKDRVEPVTTWMLFECDGGARWSSVSEDYAGKECNFSGCKCGSTVRRAGATTDRAEASAWFRRPEK